MKTLEITLKLTLYADRPESMLVIVFDVDNKGREEIFYIFSFKLRKLMSQGIFLSDFCTSSLLYLFNVDLSSLDYLQRQKGQVKWI